MTKEEWFQKMSTDGLKGQIKYYQEELERPGKLHQRGAFEAYLRMATEELKTREESWMDTRTPPPGAVIGAKIRLTQKAKDDLNISTEGRIIRIKMLPASPQAIEADFGDGRKALLFPCDYNVIQQES